VQAMYIHSEDEKEKTKSVSRKLPRISQDIGVMQCVYLNGFEVIKD